MAETWSVCGGPRRDANICPESLVGSDEGVELRGDAGGGGEGRSVQTC